MHGLKKLSWGFRALLAEWEKEMKLSIVHGNNLIPVHKKATKVTPTLFPIVYYITSTNADFEWRRSSNNTNTEKKSESEVAQSCLTLCHSMDCSLPGSSVHGISRQEYWSGLPLPSPGDLPNLGIEPWVSRIVGRRFTIWATGKVPLKKFSINILQLAEVSSSPDKVEFWKKKKKTHHGRKIHHSITARNSLMRKVTQGIVNYLTSK